MSALRELDRRLAGEVLSPAPAGWHGDFGNIRRLEPAGLVLAAGVEDVQEAVRYAGEHGLRVVARGHGCSSFGQSLSDGLVIDTQRLDQFALTGAGTVRIGGGIRWGALQRRLGEHGLTAPVVTSSEHASLGGSLSVGGFGPTSPFAGSVADQVVALDVVVGSGELVRATPDGPFADLFDHVLCGLGQVGLIVAAELRVTAEPAELLISHRGADPGDFPALAKTIHGDGRWHVCRVVHATAAGKWKVELGRLPGSGPAEAGETPVSGYHQRIFAAEAVFADGIARAQVQRGLLATAGDARRIWSDFFLPQEAAGEFFAEIGPRFSAAAFLPVVNSAFLRTDVGRRRLPLSPLPEADLVQTFGFYSVVPPDREAEYRDHFDHAAALCHQLNGRQYLHGYHRAEQSFYQDQFGAETLARWRAVKRRFDPAALLGSQLPV